MRAPGSHTSPKEKVGILYFHRSLKEEFAQKSELTDHNWLKFRALYQALEKRLQQTLSQADLPVIEVTSNQQQGAYFGQKLSHALSSAFAQGLDHVIIIGNDCPQLNPRVLAKAKEELIGGRAALGPDHQGGAYLIGISRTQFDQEAFATLPWQQPKLLEALKGYYPNAVLLDRYQDLNTRKDLRIFVPKAFGLIKTVIMSLFKVFQETTYLARVISSSWVYYCYLRPPPEFRLSFQV